MGVEQYQVVANDWPNLEFIINDLNQRVAGQELHPTSKPTFSYGTITNDLNVGGDLGVTGDLDIDGTITIDGLTASRIVATDASKGLISLAKPLIVSEGGTGASSFTDTHIMYINGGVFGGSSNMTFNGVIATFAGVVVTNSCSFSSSSAAFQPIVDSPGGFFDVRDSGGISVLNVNTFSNVVDVTGDIIASGALTGSNYTAANLLTACATNAGALDFLAASKTLTVEDNVIVSQDYTSDASPTFAGLTVTNCTVLGSDSVVFQPNADAVDFWRLNDKDGNVIGSFDTVNNRFGVRTSTPIFMHSVSYNGTNEIGFDAHFGSPAIKWSASNFHLVPSTDNTQGSVLIYGTGTGNASFRCYDAGGANFFEALCANGSGFFQVGGASSNNLHFQYGANKPVRVFGGAQSGEIQEFSIYGYRTGDAQRSLQIGVGVDAADTASFDGLSNYWFDGDVKTTNHFVVEKTSGLGIKVDLTTPTFGWADLQAEPSGINTGASKPTQATYRDTLKQFQFAEGDEEYYEYHIPHDHVPGTDIHVHVHWSHTAATADNVAGTITFEVESSYAKGHNQAAFSASVTGDFNGTASSTQYQHIVSETQLSASSPAGLQIDTDDLEPDGIIIMRVLLKTNGMTSDGAVPDPFIHHVDIHYQTTGLIGTKQKTPDFYT